MNLKDKVVVITGGSKGFGKALAVAFIDEGSKVVINSNDEQEVKKIADEIGAYGVYGDVTKEEDMTNLAGESVRKFSKIDIWINNAGLWISKKYVEDFDMSLVKKMFDVNIVGTINGCRVSLREMKKSGSGVIINVISDSALAGRPMGSAYCASKWAVDGFTKSIREENKNIKILSIFPGAMKTDIFGSVRPDGYDDFMEPQYVVDKVIENLKKENPLEELIIQK